MWDQTTGTDPLLQFFFCPFILVLWGCWGCTTILYGACTSLTVTDSRSFSLFFSLTPTRPTPWWQVDLLGSRELCWQESFRMGVNGAIGEKGGRMLKDGQREKGGCVGNCMKEESSEPETTTAVAACQPCNICHQQGGAWHGRWSNSSSYTSTAKSLQAVTNSKYCTPRSFPCLPKRQGGHVEPCRIDSNMVTVCDLRWENITMYITGPCVLSLYS